AFAIGFGLDLTAPDEIWQPPGETKTLGRLIDGSVGGSERSDAAFEVGLELLIGSLRARLERVARNS
ncbi:TetR/AcrR family transcriptional regulator, partial [Microbacterium sp. NPDC076911]